jgi:hypothetical protein
MAFRGRHTWSHPQLPLATASTETEVVLRKGKASEGEFSTVKLGNPPSPSVGTPFSPPQFLNRSFSEVSRFLNFGSVPTEFSPHGLGSEGQILVTPLSPEAIPWRRPKTTEYFPMPSFTTPPLVTVATSSQRGVSADLSPLACSLNPLLFPIPLKIPFPISPVHTPSPPSSPPPNIPMAGANPPLNRMDTIVAARYAPLILPHPMNPLPARDYLKYIPKFTGEGDITTEEHLTSFYSYANKLNIKNEDVWMRVFVQSLDGEVRKWFRGLAPGSIVGIEALDSSFLRQWGDRKDFMYYMTEFGSLKKMEGESFSEFSKRFNKMYNKIPAEIKNSEASAKMSYASAFGLDFYLLFRERRATSLAQMKDVAIEVEYNVLIANRVRNKLDIDRRKGRSKASTSGPSMPHPKVDDLTKMVKYLSTEMERMRVEGRQEYKGPQNAKKKGGFRRPKHVASLTMQRERGRDREDQKIQAPFQKKIVAEGKEGEIDDLDPEIHCFGDTPPFPHLTQSTYEESLMDNQLNELSKGDKASGNQGSYDLRSKKKTVAPDVPEQFTRTEKPTNEVADSHRGKKT